MVLSHNAVEGSGSGGCMAPSHNAVEGLNIGHRVIPHNAVVKVQTRKVSLFESCVNVAVGYGVALLAQIIIFPIFGVYVSLETNLWIGLWFTVLSIIRSFILRRIFNNQSERTLNRR